jgi:PAS domain S-box-containing protein
MLIIDMRTAMIANIIVNAVCLMVLIQLWYQNRSKYHGLSLWAIDFALLLGGTLLVILRGSVPDWASMVLSNGMIVGGTVLLFIGLSRFTGKKVSRLLIYSILFIFAIFIFVHTYYAYVNVNLLARSYNVVIGQGLGCFLAMWLLFRGVPSEFRNITKGTGIALGAIVFIGLARAIGFAFGSEPNNDYFKASVFDSIMILLLTGAVAWLTFNLALMVNKRLYQETKQMEAAVLKSQQELQATFKATTVGFAILTNRVIKEVNEALCNITGYTREELIGQNTRIWYFSDEEYLRVWQLYDTVASRGTVSTEIRLRGKNGESLNVIKNISALNKNSVGAGVVLSIIDISERKKAEDALKEELNIRANFINILAHELKSPMTPIMSSLELMQEITGKGSDEILKRLTANAFSGILVLSDRLDDLLDLARYSRGAFSLKKVSTDMARFIVEAAGRYKPSVEQSQHTLAIDIEDNLPQIEIDPARIEQVLINLLSNACKYSPAKTKVELKVKADYANLLISVTDQGKGISENDQTSLFQPYHRLAKDLQYVQGLGLGLYISKQIVEGHGGKIEIKSDAGRGSTFLVSLPLGKPKSPTN